MSILKKGLNKWKQLSLPVKASFWFVICGFLQKGISIITTPVFTRLMSTSEYGQYSVFNSWMGILTIFTTLQLCSGVYMRGMVKYEEDKERFSSAMQGLTSVVWLFCFGVYLCFRDFFNDLFHQSTLLMLAMFLMIFATFSFNFWSVRQRVDYKYRLLVGITVLASVCKPLSGIISIMLFPQYKVEARILSMTIIELLCYGGFFFMQIRRERRLYHGGYWKYALNFNLPLMPHYLSQIVLAQCDRIMIERLIDSSAAGIYSLAYSISQIMVIFNTAVLNTLSPYIYKSIDKRNFEKLEKVSYSVLLLIAFVNLLLIIFAPECISIFAPKEYYSAVYVIPPVAMSVYFIFMYTLFANFEFYFEKTHFVTIASVTGALVNIGLNYFLIPKFGFIAAGYTTLICYILYCAGHYIFMTRICRKELAKSSVYNINMILLISVIFVVAGLGIIPLYAHPAIRYIVLLIAVTILLFKRKDLLERLKEVRKGEV